MAARPTCSSNPIPFAAACAVVAAVAAPFAVPLCVGPAVAAHPGSWSTIPNGKEAGWDSLVGGKLYRGGGTHLALMRGRGDSSWVLHWHKGVNARLWLAQPGGLATVARDVPFPADSMAPWDSTEIFCSGHSHVDSLLLVAGGTVSAELRAVGSVGTIRTATFNPSTHSWAFRDTLTFGRWYPTVTTVGKGFAWATGGKRYRAVSVFGGRQGSGVSGDLRVGGTGIYGGGVSTYVAWDDDATYFVSASTHRPPPPREGHTLVYYQDADRYFIWGGVKGASFANPDTVTTDSVYIAVGEYFDTGKKWQWLKRLTDPDPTHGRPLARGWHASALVGDTLLIHGGITQGGAVLDDTWMLRALTGAANPRWRRLSVGGPPARYRHAAVLDPGNKSDSLRRPRWVIQGGRNSGGLVSAEVWVASLPRVCEPACDSSLTWQQPAVSGGPGAREGHVAVADRIFRTNPSPTHLRYFFHGGAGASGLLDDVWILRRDSTQYNWTWTAAKESSPRPAPRWLHAATHEQEWDRFRLFGGDGLLGLGSPRNDHWYFSMGTRYDDTLRWKEDDQQNRPAARSGHRMVEDPKDLFAQRHEQYDPVTGDWSLLGASSMKEVEFYPMMYQLRSGNLFYAGNSRVETPRDWVSWVLDEQQGVWGDSSSSPFWGGSGFIETRRTEARDRVMKCGGVSSASSDAPVYRAHGATAVALVDSASGATTWSSAQPMPHDEKRRWHTMTLLPNGNALMLGGFDDTVQPLAPKKRPRIWNNKAGVWAIDTLAEAGAERRYHFASLLLPDARVLTASGLFLGGPDPPPAAEIYSPPYLFERDGGGTPIRPVITSVSPGSVKYCGEFVVGVDSAASKIDTVCIIRPAAVTHGFDMDQRYVALRFSVGSSTSLTVRMTQNANLAPPGDYLLFLVRDGVPSVARWIRVERDHPDGGAPATTTDLSADLTSQAGIWVSWSAPGDDGSCCGGAAMYDLRYSTSPITEASFGSAMPATAGNPRCAGEYEIQVVGGLQGCTTYWFALKTRDEAGNWSGMSNVAEGMTMCGSGGLVAGAPQASARAGGAGQAEAAPAAEGAAPGATAPRAASGGRGLVLRRLEGGGRRWLIREAREEELRDDSGVEASGVLLDVAAEGGRRRTGRYELGASPGPIGVLWPSPPGGQFVLAGDFSLERIERLVRRPGPWAPVRLTRVHHSRLGEITGLVGDSLAVASLLAGDSVTVSYEADSGGSEAAAGHYFVVGAPARGGAAVRARPAEGVPRRFALYPSRPNPFSRVTAVRFDLPRAERVALEVWDLQGRRVARLVNGVLPAGRHAVEWDRRRAAGGPAPPGVYLYRMVAGPFRAVRKMVVTP